MKSGARIMVVGILLVIIVVAIGITVSRYTGEPEPPDWRLNKPEEKIDVETYVLITKSFAEWRELGCKDDQDYAKYMNPDTGEYTMVPAIVCSACGEKIPCAPDRPVTPYRCPKCGSRVKPGGVR